MRNLFAPAIALLDRLRYPQKFALISLIFVLPLALVLFLLLGELNASVNFSRRELAGSAYLRPLRQLLEHVPRAQIYAEAVAQGDRSVEAGLQQEQAAIDAAFAELTVMEQRFGAQLDTNAGYTELRAVYDQLQNEQQQSTSFSSQTRRDQLIKNVRSLMRHIGNTSNLILDPKLDTYYLMDVVLTKLPQGQSLLAQTVLENEQLRGIGTDQQRAHLFELFTLLQANSQETQQGLQIAFVSNAGGGIEPVLRPAFVQLTSSSDEFYQLTRNMFANYNEDKRNYRAKGLAMQSASFQLWDQTSMELDRLLQARIDGLIGKVYAVACFAAVALVLVLYLLVGFYRSVMRTVSHLELAAQRLVNGDATEKVALTSRDELSDVATSFNQIATAMLAANAQRQAVVENAVDGIMTLDAAGNVQSINAAAEAMFGVQAVQCIGQSVAALLPEYMRLDRQEHTGRYEFTGCRSDGSTFPVELALNEVFVQGQPLIVGMMRDLTERKQAEAERERLQQGIIRAQAEALKELATPLIPVTDRTVVMPLIGSIDSQRAQQIVTALLHGVEAHQASVAILDITGVPVVDTHVAQTLIQAAQAIELLGAKTVLTGIRPEVAATLVTLGVSLGRIVTCSSLQSGIAYALAHESGAAQRTQRQAM